MRVFVCPMTFLAILLIVESLYISDSTTDDAPAMWAFVDNVRSILIYNDINPKKNKEVTYRWLKDAYNSELKSVEALTWTTIQSGDKVEVRQAFEIAVTKSTHSSFPPYIFSNFFRMIKFSMSDQQLAAIKMDDFERASHLTHLNISYNSIRSLLPYTFSKANHLEVIDLSHNLISSELNEIFNSAHLQELYLDHNALAFIDLAWFNIDTLKVLTVNDNQLIKIDPTPSLHHTKYGVEHFFTDIDISNNPLKTVVNDAIILHANTVNVSNINASTCIIPFSAKVFIARHNRISSVTVKPAENYTLIELDLAYNVLSSLANLSQFNRLERLDVSNNELNTLPAQVFQHMLHLTWLNAAYNRLKTVNFGFLRHTNALKFLDISYNEMFFFRLNAITLGLEELHVEGNNLTQIDLNLKRLSPRLTRIGLNDNDWRCNYLMTAVMLLQMDGIMPVVNQTMDDENDGFEDNVKGIGCRSGAAVRNHDWYNVEVTTEYGSGYDNSIEVGERDIIEERFKQLEARMINTINEKFIDIAFRLNETANDLWHR